MSDPTISTVLAATDFSAHSHQAVLQAAAIARALGATLSLVYVDDGGEDETAHGRLTQAARGLDGIAASAHVAVGHSDEGIVATAAAIDADLIVTGTHGHTGLKRFFLGSVAEKVVRLAETNVLVSRPPRPSASDAHAGLFQRILVPTDFSEASEKALLLATTLAAPGATIELFHAWHYPSGLHAHHALPDDEQSPLAGLRREITAAAREHGARWVANHTTGELTLRFVQAYGPAAAAVQDRLEAEPFELVAMGTHGRRGFRRFMLGSVAEATVRHSPCSVLVAHAGDL
ncbi:MAG TPA: universal stress protein [Kofleriaceae bacterium]|nr:universal stress protein [Kofleriaceae bacterium]